MRNGKRKRGWSRWFLLAALAAALASAAIAVRAALKPDRSVDPSKIAAVERGDLARAVVATGKIQPRAKVEVKSKASGIVQKIFVDYGEFVRRGAVLLELDKEELQARRREADALLLAAQAAEQAAQAACERNQVEAEGPDLPFLKLSLDRALKLQSEGLLARSQVEDAEKNYQLALNRKMAALRNVAVTRAELARARAQVAQATAALERAAEDLRNATILAPVDGLVLSRNVEVGNAVSSILVLGSQATLLFTLGDVSDVYVLGKVDQADIGRVYLDQPARIAVESFKDRKFEGRVTKISPLGEEKDNVTTFEVRVSIRNPGRELRANMTANAEILLEEKRQVLTLPEAALIHGRDQRTFVEVPDASQETGKRRVEVRVGISNGVKTELASGLSEGQQVILQ